MRTRSREALTLAVTVVLLGAAITGCTGRGADPGPTTAAAETQSPAPAATPEPTPGQACEPGSHPDCSDATGSDGDTWRIIAGYADCVELLGADEAYGLCTDLDGDNQAGYLD